MCEGLLMKCSRPRVLGVFELASAKAAAVIASEYLRRWP
jgi:hypothetical protein